MLAAFVMAKINPDTTSYTSRPIKVRYTGSTEWWEPKTYSGSFAGTTNPTYLIANRATSPSPG